MGGWAGLLGAGSKSGIPGCVPGGLRCAALYCRQLGTLLSLPAYAADAPCPHAAACYSLCPRPLQDNALEAALGSRLPVVVDSHGREVDRNALVAREQTVRAALHIRQGCCC